MLRNKLLRLLLYIYIYIWHPLSSQCSCQKKKFSMLSLTLIRILCGLWFPTFTQLRHLWLFDLDWTIIIQIWYYKLSLNMIWVSTIITCFCLNLCKFFCLDLVLEKSIVVVFSPGRWPHAWLLGHLWRHKIKYNSSWICRDWI